MDQRRARPAALPGHTSRTFPPISASTTCGCPRRARRRRRWRATYGIEAFCYYHYWFGGRRILERPFDEVVDSGRPTSRSACAGRTRRGPASGTATRRHADRADAIPDRGRPRTSFRDAAARVSGPPLHPRRRQAAAADLPAGATGRPRSGAVRNGARWRAQPAWADCTSSASTSARPRIRPSSASTRRCCSGCIRVDSCAPANSTARPCIPEAAARAAGVQLSPIDRPLPARGSPGTTCYPTVIPNWDNTPRSGRNGLVLHGSTPELFERHVRAALSMLRDRPPATASCCS